MDFPTSNKAEGMLMLRYMRAKRAGEPIDTEEFKRVHKCVREDKYRRALYASIGLFYAGCVGGWGGMLLYVVTSGP